MAKGIENYPNIDTSNPTAYPNGIIKNNTGNGNGTPLNVETLADIYAFFDKLLRAAGITASGDPDNETNGHQYYEALFASPDFDAVTGLQTHWVNEGSGTYNDLQKQVDKFGVVHLRGCIKRNDTNTGNAVKICTLPPGYRPLKTEIFTLHVLSDAYGGTGVCYVTIEANGDVTPYAYHDAAALLDVLNAAGDLVSFDGVSFATF
jgi:hypothetical protein